jgi:hypothetical protein
LLEKAGSSDYDEANKFARAVPDFDTELAEAITEEQSLMLVAAVARAAEWGAFGARSLRGNRFSGLPALRAKARAFAQAKPKATAEILTAAHVNETAAEFIASHLDPIADDED